MQNNLKIFEKRYWQSYPVNVSLLYGGYTMNLQYEYGTEFNGKLHKAGTSRTYANAVFAIKPSVKEIEYNKKKGLIISYYIIDTLTNEKTYVG